MNIDDVVNRKLDKAACAEMTPAKGDEMTNDLKPCPFCGSSNLVIENLMDVVYCNDCGAEMTGDAPLGCWNARPIEDALNARIAERDALIERLVEAGELFSSGFEHDTFGVLANGIEAYGYDEGVVRGNEFLEEIQSRLNAIISEWQAMKGGDE